MGLTEIISGKARQVLYAVYAFLGVGLGATLAGFAAAPNVEVPSWLAIATAVYAFLGTAFGFTAASNVNNLAEIDSIEMPTEIHTYYGRRPLAVASDADVATDLNETDPHIHRGDE